MNRGFTLVELVVVIAMIGVMSAALIMSYNDMSQPLTDKTGDGIIYYDDIVPPEIEDYRQILQQYGITADLSDEELARLIEEIKEKAK